MPNLLSESEVVAYRERGYHFPIDALSGERSGRFPQAAGGLRERSGGPIKGEMRHRSHVLFTWINQMVRHPKILDAVEDLLGPNILCWKPAFSSRKRTIPVSCPGTRTRPIGA